MKVILSGECSKENIFILEDPTQYAETAFEAEVVQALSCLFPAYHCGVFAGAFVLENERHIADLAMIHNSLSHWFVIEVELAGHSLEHHVLPQVRCFRYGEPESSCVTSLLRGFDEMGFRREQVEQILHLIPRFVAVVANMNNSDWATSLSALDVQYLTLSVYRNHNGLRAYEMEGHLMVRQESLGFARFSAIDNSLRIPVGCGLPVGCIQIADQFGNVAGWTARGSEGVLWIRKDRGPALIEHNCYVQILRDFNGRVSIRPSHA